MQHKVLLPGDSPRQLCAKERSAAWVLSLAAGFGTVSASQDEQLLQGELVPVATPTVWGTRLSSSWRTFLEGEDKAWPVKTLLPPVEPSCLFSALFPTNTH